MLSKLDTKLSGMYNNIAHYYRYDGRTGERLRYAVPQHNVLPHSKSEYYFDNRYFTKSGKPRKSIKINSNRFYLEGHK